MTVKVALVPAGNVTASAMSPDPPAAAQLAPAPLAAHVHAPPTRAAGSASVTSAFVAVDGPAFATTTL